MGFLDHGAKNDPKISKSERNEMELRSFNHSIRLNEQIILVGSFVQIGCKMVKLWRSKYWTIMATRVHFRVILGQLLAILFTFLEIFSSNLVCPSIISSITSKPIVSPIGLEIPMLAHKNHQFGHFDASGLFWTYYWPL